MALERTHDLPDGRRVRVRMPHGSDRQRVAALHTSLGLATRPLDLQRVLHFDPRRRMTVVALVQEGARETLTGYAAGEVGADGPDLLVADESQAPGVAAVLREALRARTAGRRAA